MSKSRKQKQAEYDQKYSGIPVDYRERLAYMCDLYQLTDRKMEEILKKRIEMLNNLEYRDLLIVLYQEPEGQGRPRFRFIGPKNYMDAAKFNPGFVQVYSPHATEDSTYFHRLYGQELDQLHQFIQTQCIITYNAYFPMNKSLNVTDTFLAEIGLHRYDLKPDWDNIGKKYSDFYNDRVWLDDALVVSGTVNKFYSILPRVEIYLRYMNYATNKKQYDRIVSKKGYKPDYPITYLDAYGRPYIE